MMKCVLGIVQITDDMLCVTRQQLNESEGSWLRLLDN